MLFRYHSFQASSLCDLVALITLAELACLLLFPIYAPPSAKWQEALIKLEESLSISQSMGDEFAVAITWNSLANAHLNLLQYSEALAALDESIQLAKKLGDLRTVSMATGNKGALYADQGDYEKAFQITEEMLAIQLQIGVETNIAYANMALFAVYSGRPSAMVEEYAQNALRNALAQHNLTLVLAVTMIYGCLYAQTDQITIGLEYIGLNIAKQNVPASEMKYFVEPLFERLRQQISEEALQAALARGAKLDVESVGRSLLKA